MYPEDETERTPEERERRRRIRRWYDEAMALGISEDEFFRQMTPIVSDEEIERALSEPDDEDDLP